MKIRFWGFSFIEGLFIQDFFLLQPPLRSAHVLNLTVQENGARKTFKNALFGRMQLYFPCRLLNYPLSSMPRTNCNFAKMRLNQISIALALLLLFSFSNAQNVGIGISAPVERLHVNGNLRFDGALMPNGLPGTSGQVLISQGAGVAPIWSSVGGIIGTFKAASTRTLISSTAFTQINGLTQTINLPTAATVIISTYGSIEVISSSFFGGSGAIIQVFDNGVAIPDMFQTMDVQDAGGFFGTINPWGMMNSMVLPAGNHTITVRARRYAFDNFYAGGNTTAPNPNEGALILMVFPQ